MMRKLSITILMMALVLLLPIISNASTYKSRRNNYGLTAKEIRLIGGKEVLNSWPTDVSTGRIRTLKKALALLGKTRYGYGAGHGYSDLGKVPASRCGALDCSSFVSWALSRARIVRINYCTLDFYDSRYFSSTRLANILPMDVALIGAGRKNRSLPDHVGFYLGRKNGRMLWLHCTASVMPGGVVINSDTRFILGASTKYGQSRPRYYTCLNYKNF